MLYISLIGFYGFFFAAAHVSSGGGTNELARKYFSQLSLDTVKKLYNIYQVDFKMFGYSPQWYYDIAKIGPEV